MTERPPLLSLNFVVVGQTQSIPFVLVLFCLRHFKRLKGFRSCHLILWDGVTQNMPFVLEA